MDYWKVETTVMLIEKQRESVVANLRHALWNQRENWEQCDLALCTTWLNWRGWFFAEAFYADVNDIMVWKKRPPRDDTVKVRQPWTTAPDFEKSENILLNILFSLHTALHCEVLLSVSNIFLSNNYCWRFRVTGCWDANIEVIGSAFPVHF